MKKPDLQVRTPIEKILLFTVEYDEKGTGRAVVRKGKKTEVLTVESLAKIMYEILEYVRQ